MVDRKLHFIDFEASSLDSGSYPIEIAWMYRDGRGESHLIQPHWSWHGWSAASERLHHITQDMLRDASPAVDIARKAHSVLSDSIVIADEIGFDQYWLDMLLKLINAPSIVVHGIDALIGEEIKRVRSAQRELHLDQAQAVAMVAYEESKRGHPHEHRALPDAREIWRGWRAVQTAIDSLIEKKSRAG